ncbi:YlbF family regulator [Sporolactobacillus sp. THM7-7]|nr:YlbF family regulator [Sporolactobacillus sp. THM7-7]
MIATLENVSLLDETDELASMLIHSEIFAYYLACRDAADKDGTAQKLIRQFLKIKEKYDEVQRFGRYHPDYKPVIRQMMDAKRDMDLHPTIAAYKQAEKEVSDLLGAVSLRLARAVSESIKVPTGDPFFDRSCSTGCGGGGQCRCRSGVRNRQKKN